MIYIYVYIMCIFIKMYFFFLDKSDFELMEASKWWSEVVGGVLSLRQNRNVGMERKLTGLKDSAVKMCNLCYCGGFLHLE